MYQIVIFSLIIMCVYIYNHHHYYHRHLLFHNNTMLRLRKNFALVKRVFNKKDKKIKKEEAINGFEGTSIRTSIYECYKFSKLILPR